MACKRTACFVFVAVTCIFVGDVRFANAQLVANAPDEPEMRFRFDAQRFRTLRETVDKRLNESKSKNASAQAAHEKAKQLVAETEKAWNEARLVTDIAKIAPKEYEVEFQQGKETYDGEIVLSQADLVRAKENVKAREALIQRLEQQPHENVQALILIFGQKQSLEADRLGIPMAQIKIDQAQSKKDVLITWEAPVKRKSLADAIEKAKRDEAEKLRNHTKAKEHAERLVTEMPYPIVVSVEEIKMLTKFEAATKAWKKLCAERAAVRENPDKKQTISKASFEELERSIESVQTAWDDFLESQAQTRDVAFGTRLQQTLQAAKASQKDAGKKD